MMQVESKAYESKKWPFGDSASEAICDKDVSGLDDAKTDDLQYLCDP